MYTWHPLCTCICISATLPPKISGATCWKFQGRWIGLMQVNQSSYNYLEDHSTQTSQVIQVTNGITMVITYCISSDQYQINYLSNTIDLSPIHIWDNRTNRRLTKQGMTSSLSIHGMTFQVGSITLYSDPVGKFIHCHVATNRRNVKIHWTYLNIIECHDHIMKPN